MASPPSASPAPELPRLTRALRRAPEDPDDWLRLEHLLARATEQVPTELLRRELPRLRAWARERAPSPGFARLVLAAVGLRAAPAEDPTPAAWAREASDPDLGPWEPETGLPVRARRRADGAEVVLIPGGAQATRRPEADPLDDRLQLRQRGAAYLDRYPVTVRRYAGFLAATGHRPPLYWRVQAARPGRPVVFVDLDDVVAYGAWSGGRPPWEAEWEAAAQAGEAPYPWGSAEPDETRVHAFRGSSRPDLRAWDRHLHEVHVRPAGTSPLGVVDLMGNACEWCLADAGSYTPGASRGAAREVEEHGGVMRGSSWRHPESQVLVAARRRLGARTREGWLGFRLATPLEDA